VVDLLHLHLSFSTKVVVADLILNIEPFQPTKLFNKNWKLLNILQVYFTFTGCTPCKRAKKIMPTSVFRNEKQKTAHMDQSVC